MAPENFIAGITRSAICAVCVVFAVFLAGCAPTRFSNPFLTLVPQASGVSGSAISVTASCGPGKERIGGGFFLAPDNHNSGLVVRGSYPVEPNAWTVEVENTASVPNDGSSILALAYCVQRSDLTPRAAIQTSTVDAPVGGGALATKTLIDVPCQRPASLTGGGFRLNGVLDSSDAQYNAGVYESAPETAVWHVEFGEGLHAPGTRQVQVFAVCTTGLQPGTLKVQSATPVPGVQTVTEVLCDQSQYTTAGGFRLNGKAHGSSDPGSILYVGRAYQSAAVAEFLHWSIQTSTVSVAGGGPAPVAAVALCAPIP